MTLTEKCSAEIINIIENHMEYYSNISDETASVNLSEDKWSLKEIIGHLIDSASNNHQRMVRLQTEKIIEFPGYHFSWNKIQKINSMKYSDILQLWKYYNILLAHIIKNTSRETLANIWDNGQEKFTFEKIITWYISHMKDHLQLFKERYAEINTIK
ncbi:MAG: DinB family protein [Spirochaetes bacterium]|nr:DinB family protein [Spirochaetota bacterium]